VFAAFFRKLLRRLARWRLTVALDSHRTALAVRKHLGARVVCRALP
jgi:hypothetical protein